MTIQAGSRIQEKYQQLGWRRDGTAEGFPEKRISLMLPVFQQIALWDQEPDPSCAEFSQLWREPALYRLTNGLLISIAERYGSADYVAKNGPDVAIQQATRNVAAALFGFSDDPNVRYLRALPEDLVSSILQKHGLD
ncbi:unnamed protein product [Durusdinium trenchii]|uniref:Uncharacterized protein n=1 Tax=Durusdinium trenchii TaxID=1381693 RepID=A0ABP0MIF8_9DINO